MKIKIFQSDNLEELEKEVQTWLNEQEPPPDITHFQQSENALMIADRFNPQQPKTMILTNITIFYK